MKINHKMIQLILRVLGLSVFIVTVSIKLRNLVIHGGTKIVKEDSDGNEVDNRTKESYRDEGVPTAEPVSEVSDSSAG